MLVQNTYTPFLDLWGTQPPWESCEVSFTPQIALFFCWLYSWLTFPLHAHILTGRSITNTVNLGWKLSWFLTHFFFQVRILAGHLAFCSGYHGAEPTVLVRFRPCCRLWGNICSQAQCLLVKFSFSLLKIRFLIFLLDIHHGSIFGNLTLSVTKNILVVDLVSVGAHEKEKCRQRMQWAFIKQWLLPLYLEDLSSFLTRGLSHLQISN